MTTRGTADYEFRLVCDECGGVSDFFALTAHDVIFDVGPGFGWDRPRPGLRDFCPSCLAEEIRRRSGALS